MNMKFKHIAAVLAGAAALSAPSCDLNEKFYSEVTPDTFFTSPESTYAVLCCAAPSPIGSGTSAPTAGTSRN